MIIEKSSTSKKKVSCSIPRKPPPVSKNGNAASVGRVRRNKNGIELVSEIIPVFIFNIPEIFMEYILYYVPFILLKRKKKGTLFLFYVELLI